MDWLEFTADIVKAVAWPASAVAMVVLLRRPLARLIASMKSLKYGSVEVSFRRELKRAAKLASSSSAGAATALAAADPEEKELAEHLTALAIVSPETALLDSWRSLEQRLMEVARRRKLELAPAAWQMPLVVAAFLLGEGDINESQNALLHRLQHLRHRIIHDPRVTLTASEATEYVALAMGLRASLK